MFSSFHPSTGLTQRYLYVLLSFFPLPSPRFQAQLCTLLKSNKRLGKTSYVVKCVVLSWVLSAPYDGICPHDAFLSWKVHWVLWRLSHRLPGSPIVCEPNKPTQSISILSTQPKVMIAHSCAAKFQKHTVFSRINLPAALVTSCGAGLSLQNLEPHGISQCEE